MSGVDFLFLLYPRSSFGPVPPPPLPTLRLCGSLATTSLAYVCMICTGFLALTKMHGKEVACSAFC